MTIADRLAGAPPVIQGRLRQWVRCRQCIDISYYDYQPYSLSNPIRLLPCGHGAAQRWDEAVDHISEDEAAAAIEAEQKAGEKMQQDNHANGLTVTTDKDLIVQDASRTGGRVWRFQSKIHRKRNKDSPSEEVVQAILADYVDHPERKVMDIVAQHGISNGFLWGLLREYGIPQRLTGRQPGLPSRRKTKPQQVPAVEPDGPPPNWRVTMVRTVTEEIRAESLLDIAAMYDLDDVHVTKIEEI